MTTAHSHGGESTHGGSALHRFASFEVDEHAVPHMLDEAWRFTPLKRLHSVYDDASFGSWDDHQVVVSAAPEATVEFVSADDARRGLSGTVPWDRVSARAWAASASVAVVTIPRETKTSVPTMITLTGTSAEKPLAGHVVIVAEAHAEGVVVLDFLGSATLVENVEIVAGEGAQLTVVSVQDWAADATHVTYHHVRVGRDALVRHGAVSLGGDLVRMSAAVRYDGPGGDVEMLGLYYADAGQHLEHRLFVDHAQPHCRSNVLYKGALQGQDAHTVWIGDVLIRPTAVGTDTFELNRNLVLTDGTRADSVPNLEIETGDIAGAGHASATGRFDDEQLFYLQARGIPVDEARRLVVRGYFVDLINRLGVPELVDRLTAAVEGELEGAPV